MKNSERLKKEADTCDNDLAYMGKMKQVYREQRLEKFQDADYISRLKAKGLSVKELNYGTKITIGDKTDKFGIIDYFPKANKVLIRKDNRWIIGGLNWINQNLIK